ncbi:MAG: zinc ribbon domain-containing protein [Anaerolineales bacterium]
MPSYEFHCPSCGETFEKRLPYTWNLDEVICPSGHRNVRRIYSAPAVIFRGSGFYVTDHQTGISATPKDTHS